ncbi:MAG TPA: lytic transglycosylase domain-containing protein [Candidatus Binataceae bacterium]
MKRLKVLVVVLVLVAAPAAGALAQQADGPPVLDMGRLYQIVGHIYDIDPFLLEAIATAESNGNPDAVSPKGAQGLMQLMPGTARRYRVDHPFDPVENVFGAARFLTGLRAWSRVQGNYGEVDLPAMIAAYNAGPGAVEKYGGIPPYAETQAYVRKVLWLYLLGQPPPRRLNPMHTSTHAAYAAAAPALRPAAAGHHAAKHAFAPTQPGSLIDQVAEIKRRREAAKSREMAARAELDSN